MGATSIYYNGRLNYKPGSYSKIDATALEAVGLSASGFVAVVGTAVGGKPYDAIDVSDVPGELQSSTRPGQAADYFLSGNLYDSEPLSFAPSLDSQIEGGAQKVYYVKVNKATQSTATFLNADGNCMLLTSTDYGYHTTQINVEIGDGTNKGKMVTITLSDTEEVLDDLGGDAMFTLMFTATVPANGYTTLVTALTSGAMTVTFTLAHAGMDSDITNQVAGGYPASAKVEVVSSNVGDIGTVILYGVDDSGDPQSEEVTLNGITPVQSANSYGYIFGGRMIIAPAGTVTCRNLGVGTTIFTLALGSLTKGILVCSDISIAGTTLSLAADGASTAMIGIWGTSATAAAQNETVVLNGTTAVPTTSSWRTVTIIGLGLLAAARTVTISGTAHLLSYSVYDTITKIVDYFNGRTGYTAAMVTALTSFSPVNMDYVSNVNILSLSAVSFYANLYAIIQGINDGSGLVAASRLSPGTGAPSNTGAPVYLVGGNEGSTTPGLEGTPYTTAADWQAALDLLKKVFVNSVVVITYDPAVHAMLRAHCAYMCGAGKMERDGFVGIAAGVGSLATKTVVKSQIVSINSRHIRAVAQQCERYNADGTRTKYDPPFTACLAAGMQAGSEVGTSHTFKYVNTLGAYQHSSWNPADDAEEMIAAGLLFMELVDGVGLRWVRNVTTCLSSNNIAYTDGAVNEAVNYSAYNFRTTMEFAVGRKGFDGTEQATEQVARGVLTGMMGLSITAWRALTIDLTLDVLAVSVELAPVISINFVTNELHLVTG